MKTLRALFLIFCWMPFLGKTQVPCPTNVLNQLDCGCSITVSYVFYNGTNSVTCAGGSGTLTVNHLQTLPIVCPTNCTFNDLEVTLIAICGNTITPVTVSWNQAGTQQYLNCNVTNPNNGFSCCDNGSIFEFGLGGTVFAN